jgi:hypothetical protein
MHSKTTSIVVETTAIQKPITESKERMMQDQSYKNISSKDTTQPVPFFLDLDRPLLAQIWASGYTKEFYLEQVHKPHFYKGDGSAPLFGNFLEPLTKTKWWIVPLLWFPFVAYGTYMSACNLRPAEVLGYWGFGFCAWTLIEYCMHRFLFHIDK